MPLYADPDNGLCQCYWPGSSETSEVGGIWIQIQPLWNKKMFRLGLFILWTCHLRRYHNQMLEAYYGLFLLGLLSGQTWSERWIRFRNKSFRIRQGSYQVPVRSYSFSVIITNMHDFHVGLYVMSWFAGEIYRLPLFYPLLQSVGCSATGPCTSSRLHQGRRGWGVVKRIIWS